MRPRLTVSIACALRGHEDLLHFAPGRLFLRCQRCRRETAGWIIEASTTQTAVESALRQPRLAISERHDEIWEVQQRRRAA